MSTLARLTIQAPAKINLFLKILGRRADGYHDIYSLVQTVDLCDTIDLEKREAGISLTCDADAVPTGRDNIVWRAVELLRQECGFSGGVSIHLKKRIPVGGGLGGGSSDAAATLKGLNQLLELGLSVEKLANLGGILGSDVPLFFSGGQCLISERGEIVESINLPTTYKIVLIVPDFAVSTAQAYAELRFPLTTLSAKPTFSVETANQSFYKSLRYIGNDFMDVFVHEHPEVAMVMETLRRAGARHVQLSGSGSAFYGLFDGEPGLDANALLKDRIGWLVFNLNPTCIKASQET